MIRLLTVVSILMTALGGFGLYRLKYQVQALDRQVASLQEQVDRDRDAMRILRAEWVYLTRPQRLQDLAARYLPLGPVGALQIARNFDAVPMRNTTLAADRAPDGANPSPGEAPGAPRQSPPSSPAGGMMHAISYQGR